MSQDIVKSLSGNACPDCNEDIENALAEIISLRGRVAFLEDQMEGEWGTLRDAQAENAELRERLNQKPDGRIATWHELRERLTASETENESLRERVKYLEGVIANADAEFVRMNEQIAGLTKDAGSIS